jgi:hypothetical protein
MKVILTILILCSIFILSIPQLKAQTLPVYPDNEISDVFIIIDPDSLGQIYADGNQEANHEYPATFIFANSFTQDTIANIGFRLRGNTSRHAYKKSFKVSFNTFQPGLKFYGYEKLNLNGEHNDPSIIRSKLSWDLFKLLDIGSSDASYVRLYINDNYHGLYINIEHIDENFVDKKFNSTGGNLYKCLWPADLTYISNNPDDYKFNSGDRRTYDLKTNNQTDDYSDIAEFINILNNTPAQQFTAELDPIFNIDQYLRILAVDAVTSSWDNYWFLKNNYYLYHNPVTNKFEFIPYDYDNTFGIWWDGILGGVDWGTRDIFKWGNPFESRPLATRILEVPEYRNRFSYYLSYLLESGFKPENIFAKIDSIHTMISGAAQIDTFRTLDYGYTFDDFNKSYNEALGDHVTYGLKPYISTRHSSAMAQISSADISPIITSISHYPTAVQTTDSIKITAQISDDQTIDQVKLFYSEESVWTELEMMMIDTKANNLFNEYVYSVTLPPYQTDSQINFYIVATDNSGKVSSLPIGSPNKFIQLKIGYENPGLFINEFLAGNDSLVADEFGEYDDWIEVYNGDSKDINLEGFYLSDKFEVPNKWAFPDTTIKAGGFLILWADEDQEQGAMHTNFKLNRSGEQLGIFNSDSTNFAPVDTITFLSQMTNVSYGRYPDGTDSWVSLVSPTPGSANEYVNNISNLSDNLPMIFQLDQNYPNPFNPVTAIGYRLPALSFVKLSIYNNLGQIIATLVSERQPAGVYKVEWNAGHMASGVYYYQITAGEFRTVKKMILLK